MTDTEAAATRGIARALGPFLIVFGIAVAMKAGEFPLLVPAFFQDGVLVFVTSAFTLAIGLALLAAHHHWATPAAIIISVFAILTTIRGAALMLAPAFVATLSATFVRTPGAVFIPAAVAVLVGAYLTFVSWFSKSSAT